MQNIEKKGRRAFMGSAAMAALLLGTRAAWAFEQGGAGRWPKVAPPQSPRISHVIDQLGRQRDDAYSWMKFIPATGERTHDNLPEAVGAMLKAENAYADAILAPLASERAKLLDAMLARASGDTAAPALEKDGWDYESARLAGAAHAIYTRKRKGGTPEQLVDEAVRAKGQPYFRSTGHQPSPDHRYFAWAEDVIGNDRHRIVIRDNQSGEIRTIVGKDAYGYGGLVFAPSSRWLFWIWRDAHNRPTRLYRTSADGKVTDLVYEEKDPAIFMQVKRTAADGFIALTLAGPETAEVRLVSAADETAAPAIVWPRKTGVLYDIDEWNDGLIALTDADDAFDMALWRLDPKSFRTLETLVPHRPGTPILQLQPFAAALVRLERVDGLHRLVILRPDGSERTVAFDDPAYAIELPGEQSYGASSVMIVHQSPKSPRRWIRVDLASGKQSVVQEQAVANFDPDDYEVERLFAPAPTARWCRSPCCRAAARRRTARRRCSNMAMAPMACRAIPNFRSPRSRSSTAAGAMRLRMCAAGRRKGGAGSSAGASSPSATASPISSPAPNISRPRAIPRRARSSPMACRRAGYLSARA